MKIVIAVVGLLSVAGSALAQAPPAKVGPEYVTGSLEWETMTSRRASSLLPGRLNSSEKLVVPSQLLERGVPGGALLECRIAEQGALTDCVILSEFPADKGVGRATLEAPKELRAKPLDKDGASVIGKYVILPVMMVLDDEQLITQTLWGRRSFFVSERRDGTPFSEAACNHAPTRTCYAYDLEFSNTPRFEQMAALVAQSGKMEGRSIFDCEIRPDGGLTRCVASPDVTDAQIRPLAQMIGQFRMPLKFKGNDTSTGRALIAFDWTQMNKVIAASAIGRAR